MRSSQCPGEWCQPKPPAGAAKQAIHIFFVQTGALNGGAGKFRGAAETSTQSKNVDGKGLLDRCWPVKSQVVTGMLVNLKVAETSTWCIGARSLQEHWASLEAQFGGFN